MEQNRYCAILAINCKYFQDVGNIVQNWPQALNISNEKLGNETQVKFLLNIVVFQCIWGTKYSLDKSVSFYKVTTVSGA